MAERVSASPSRAPDPHVGRPTGTGPGRVLVAIYGLFALSASARAAVQIATKFHEAPVAFLLSALAAVIYIVATVALARNDRRLALACCSVELFGVLAVGTASLVDKAAFPEATVWSGYGQGYGFIPLILPIVGLWWIRRTRQA
jgi:cytochrome bd-type quinol oxidase subunit 2